MTQTLFEAATAYQPKANVTTKNISELGLLNLSLPLIDDSFTDKVTGEVKVNKVVVVNDIKYRVPQLVLEQIQKIIKTAAVYKQKVSLVKVTRSGQGQKDTRYNVEPVKEIL